MSQLPERFGGKYRVLRSLARGGMGEVFLARHEGPGDFSRDVVIKTLLPDLAEDESLVEMFLSEARVAALLTHQNIVHLYDFGEQDGTYFIVMELLEGESLAAILRAARRAGRRLTYGFVAAIGSQVCAGLSYAWTRPGPDGAPLRLVHRDISPQNVLACSDGSAKILDFGIARYAGSSSHTSPGALKGKPSYLSPEHLGVAPVDCRSDLFCLGIVLWELVAGRRLFTDDLAQSARRVAHEPAPDLARVDPSAPPELAAAVGRALRIEAGERFSSAAEMGRALDAFLLHSGAVGADEVRHELARFAAGKGAPAPKPEPVTGRAAPDFPVPSWLAGDSNPFETPPPVFADLPPPVDLSAPGLIPGALALDGPPPLFDTSAPLLDPEAVDDRRPDSNAAAPAAPPRPAPTQGRAFPPCAAVEEEPLELAAPVQQFQPQPEPAPAPAREPAGGPPSRPRPAPSRPGSAAPVPRAASGGALPPAALYLLVLGGLAVALALFFYLRPERGAAAVIAPEAARTAEAADFATTSLSVDSSPSGAAIALDGKPTGQPTPAKLTVESGREHTVELSHPDCFPFKTTFFAAPHETSTVQASLKRGARIRVTSDPAGAQVDLDGKAAFTAPGRSALLAPGRHFLLARLPGMAFDFTELQILDDEQPEWSAKLVPGAAVQVSSEPEGAAISLDGRATGLVTPAELWVAAGKKHVVRLALEGLQPFSQTLKAAREGSALKVSGTLQSAKVVELKGELAALEARLAAGERKLEKLRSQQSGVVVKDVRQELELKLRIEDLEAELERGQTEAAILREELDKASGPTR